MLVIQGCFSVSTSVKVELLRDDIQFRLSHIHLFTLSILDFDLDKFILTLIDFDRVKFRFLKLSDCAAVCDCYKFIQKNVILIEVGPTFLHCL